ncbi:DUF3164 family protein [Pseudoalteromonas sp. NEC-BIFX-2020_002]|uniref:DUF3164 family protein n=1 Tax=Pseudoalteromonas sp. NEC-BIFX-2020_002 TaxID=2732353 RepID=UPI0014769B93|nr:DUF3164 family protein [Pseudoalteromonas sp. NEC-BIFX-2020_002]NNG45001.1 DUF3164 family protein [Pseudoalteromonas sp. NEC-BIFX-2020_002]
MPKEFLINHKGHQVPLKAIRPADIIRHEFVQKAIELAKAQSYHLAEFKKQQMGEFDAFMGLLAQEYAVEMGGKKGNVTLRSFDHKQKITLQVQESIELGPELLIAKDLIDECLNEWSANANENLKLIIEQTFATDKKGKVSVQKVLGLRRLKITDDSGKWQRAMDIIADAIQVIDSTRFIRFYETVGELERAISLDIAKL